MIVWHYDCCGVCGINFALEEKVIETWQKVGKSFYCPNGHPLVAIFKGESPEKKLKDTQIKCDNLQKKIEELVTELEIWKPREVKADE